MVTSCFFSITIGVNCGEMYKFIVKHLRYLNMHYNGSKLRIPSTLNIVHLV